MEITNNKKPLVSVIIATYNYGHFIEEAIESVLNQTFPQRDVEIIIVDDGSTDDSSERVQKYRDRIKYIYKENGGHASALNVGFESAEGEIIAFLDSDDYWHPEKLSLVAQEYQKSERMDFIYHFMNVVNNNHKIIDRYIYPAPSSKGRDGLKERYLDTYLRGKLPWFSPTSGMAIRADCLKEAMPIPEECNIGSDIYLHYILPFYIRELSLIRKPLGYYRMHSSNIWGGDTLTPDKVSKTIDLIQHIKGSIENHSQKLGFNSYSIKASLHSLAGTYGVMLDNLQGRKLRAIKKAVFFQHFLPDDSAIYKMFKKITLLISALLPSSLYLWLLKQYRKVLSLLYKLIP